MDPEPAAARASPDPLAAAAPRGVRRVLGSATLDLRPLQHREFRLLFGGQGVSFFGSMVTYVAIPYQVYLLTSSSLAVGLVSLPSSGRCWRPRCSAVHWPTPGTALGWCCSRRSGSPGAQQRCWPTRCCRVRS